MADSIRFAPSFASSPAGKMMMSSSTTPGGNFNMGSVGANGLTGGSGGLGGGGGMGGSGGSPGGASPPGTVRGGRSPTNRFGGDR